MTEALPSTGTPPWEISNSEIQTFKHCRRRWYLSYYRALQPKDRAPSHVGPLALGTRVHEALDRSYKQDESFDNLLTIYAELVAEDTKKAWADGADIGEFDRECELGRRMLEGFQEWADETGFNADYELLDTEILLSAELIPDEVVLKGKIDMRMRRRSDGTIEIRDWKTTANFADFEGTAHMSEQVLTYMLLSRMNQEPGDRPVDRGVFTLLKKVRRTAAAKPPFFKQVTVAHNENALKAFYWRLVGTARDMLRVKKALDAGGDHLIEAYPTVSRECTWICPFFQYCYMMDDGSDYEQALADNFQKHNPYDYHEPRKTEPK